MVFLPTGRYVAPAMLLDPTPFPPVSGSVRRVERRRGAVWYAKYRVPDPSRPGRVRQIEKQIGRDWTEGGPPPPGWHNRRTAQAALEAMLTDARRGAVELARTGVTFEHAAIEWLRWGEHERGWKRATLVDRRSVLSCHLLPEFGALRVEQITTRRIEGWKMRWLAEHNSRRQGAKLLAILHGIMERARKARTGSSRTRSPTSTRSASATTPRATTSTCPRRSTRSPARCRPSRTRR
jgi:hypothetical protein